MGFCRESLAVGIVRIDDGRLDSIAIFSREEHSFGLKIAFHVLMEIEMIVRKIHKDAYCKLGAKNALQSQRVG